MHQDGEMIYFARDNGAEFEMSYVKMLFGLFQLLHSTYELPFRDKGLATLIRAINCHRGREWVKQPPRRTTFYFTFLALSHSHIKIGV